ncbi:cytochrome P450 [Mycena epipterygia]|nr:cytochrome P450 [Mycena epipterygia]
MSCSSYWPTGSSSACVPCAYEAPLPRASFSATKKKSRASGTPQSSTGAGRRHGSVYTVRGPLGSERLVLCDPKAIAHMYALDSWKYFYTLLARQQLSSLTGPTSLLFTLGEAHSRINNVSFDVVGLAAFSHDFKSLDGDKSAVASALAALGHSKPSPNVAKIFLLSQAYLILLKLSLPSNDPMSALGALLNAKELSAAQVFASTQTTLLAGFATTTVRPRGAFDAPREAGPPLSRARIVYHDEFTNDLPYLDAVVRETLCLHPVLSESTRVALEDDILPLATPLRTASGVFFEMFPTRKGTVLTTSLLYTNVSMAIWGADVAAFRPERWLDGAAGVLASARVSGGFALTEMKIVLAIFIRTLLLAPRDEVGTVYEKAFFLMPH